MRSEPLTHLREQPCVRAEASRRVTARIKCISSLAVDERVGKTDVREVVRICSARMTRTRLSIQRKTRHLQMRRRTLRNIDSRAEASQTRPHVRDEQTHAALASQRLAFMSVFRPQYRDGDIEGRARIHLNIERWRVCETWFAPSTAGVDSAGLGKVLQHLPVSCFLLFPILTNLSIDARTCPDGTPARMSVSRNADPPAGNVAPDRARRGPILGCVDNLNANIF
ncbi:hypothetical protein BJV77DRAFT_798443 [Russula vinacea]|nr:hypothetical protein BJV77DRAFT_798443 [Russula vinacea]